MTQIEKALNALFWAQCVNLKNTSELEQQIRFHIRQRSYKRAPKKNQIQGHYALFYDWGQVAVLPEHISLNFKTAHGVLVSLQIPVGNLYENFERRFSWRQGDIK